MRAGRSPAPGGAGASCSPQRLQLAPDQCANVCCSARSLPLRRPPQLHCNSPARPAVHRAPRRRSQHALRSRPKPKPNAQRALRRAPHSRRRSRLLARRSGASPPCCSSPHVHAPLQRTARHDTRLARARSRTQANTRRGARACCAERAQAHPQQSAGANSSLAYNCDGISTRRRPPQAGRHGGRAAACGGLALMETSSGALAPGCQASGDLGVRSAGASGRGTARAALGPSTQVIPSAAPGS
jgi:hypothetical protein